VPTTALKHLAKRAGVKLSRAEHLWDKAGDIVSAEYDVDKSDSSYWALRMGITKRMLGLSENKMTLKTFLEAAEKKPPQYNKLSSIRAIEFLNARCQNALWMLALNKPLFRGDNVAYDFAMVDTSKTTRVSENTTNFYTLILDNNPSMADFPKRSRSFIGTVDYYRAEQYGQPFIMIPADDAKIGVVGSEDIWDARINFFERRRTMYVLNSLYEQLDLDDIDINSFYKLDRRLKQDDPEKVDKFYEALSIALSLNEEQLELLRSKNAHREFMESIFNAYSPAETGFKWYYTSNMPKNLYDTEVWVSGEVLVMSEEEWKKLDVKDGKFSL
jgi:hypothetical protein